MKIGIIVGINTDAISEERFPKWLKDIDDKTFNLSKEKWDNNTYGLSSDVAIAHYVKKYSKDDVEILTKKDISLRKSPTKQLKNPHWYKVNGKKVTYADYKKAWKEGIDNRRPNLQTNDPDPFGLKAKRAADRAKLPKKHTVLTEQQTKNLKK